FVNWPHTAFHSSDAPFVIGIIGNDPFGSYIEGIVEGEKVGDRDIIVHRYSDIKDITNCQILFISITESAKIKEILSAIEHQNILTVSDDEHFVKSGGQVRFFKESNKVRIQINITAAKKSQLEISSKLLRIAKTLK
ncbi:MAG: YfiR family protein, partial [Pedobacter sp.]